MQSRLGLGDRTTPIEALRVFATSAASDHYDYGCSGALALSYHSRSNNKCR
jgi:hypothetical protein